MRNDGTVRMRTWAGRPPAEGLAFLVLLIVQGDHFGTGTYGSEPLHGGAPQGWSAGEDDTGHGDRDARGPHESGTLAEEETHAHGGHHAEGDQRGDDAHRTPGER